MESIWGDYRLFLKEFRRTFRTTGAVLPSGPALSKALAQGVDEARQPIRILEVGPGTGAVTRYIAAGMGSEDTLDLVELNETFVQRLRQRLDSEPAFAPIAARTTIHHRSIEDLAPQSPYDVVISGLPLNNFEVVEVQRILAALVNLVCVGGTLSFFEYIAIRQIKGMVGGSRDRLRLRGISDTLNRLFAAYPVERRWIWPNVPPAWVHRVTVVGSDDAART